MTGVEVGAHAAALSRGSVAGRGGVPEFPAPLRVRYFSKGTAVDPGSRYRIHQYLPVFRSLGVEVDVLPLFGDGYLAIAGDPHPLRRAIRRAAAAAIAYSRRATRLGGGRAYDLVVVERQLFPYLPAWAETLLLGGGPPVAVEFDDAVYLTRGHAAKLARLLALARLAIVGNGELADFAARHCREVAVVPTTVDVARYRPKRDHRDRDRLVIGWIGLPYNLPSLARLTAPLQRLSREVPLELRVISSAAPDIPGVAVRFVPWSAALETEALADLDVGVMPLPDDLWSRGKCALKLLQYMAAGVPAVASPVGINREVIVDGENGRLAANDEEWYATLHDLARSPALRARLGAEGRRTVEARFALAAWAPKVAALYRRAAGAA